MLEKFDSNLLKYADLAVKVGVNIQKDQYLYSINSYVYFGTGKR